MTPEELNTAIYHKMEAEQDSYRDWLLTLLPDEILQHAYEYAVRQDILFAIQRPSSFRWTAFVLAIKDNPRLCRGEKIADGEGQSRQEKVSELE